MAQRSTGQDEVVVSAQGVSKEFTTTSADPGLRGAIKGLLHPKRVTVRAISDIDLQVCRGELVLLLGPNGAGKSTLIKVLTGVVRATSGLVRVAGVDPRADHRAHAKAIGTVFGQRSQLWWDLPVRQSLEILRHIYDLPEAVVRRRIAQFDEILALSEFWDNRMRHLSLGQRVRADLAAALLHEPAVIFLDEPTIGMDVVAKEQVRLFLRREVQERGCGVLLTTHDMNEVKRLGSRVVVINHGHIVSDGDIGMLLRQFGGGFRIKATVSGSTAPPDLPGLLVADREGPVVTFAPRPGAALTVQQALAEIVRTIAVDSIAVEEDDLEDVMRKAFVQPDDSIPAPAGQADPGAVPHG